MPEATGKLLGNIFKTAGRLTLTFAAFLSFHVSTQPGFAQSAASTTPPVANNGYVDEVIDEILRRTNGPDAAEYRVANAYDMSRDRLLSELVSGELIEYAAVATKPEWEAELIPIRIPLRKGLQGYRILFILGANQETHSRIETLEDLRSLSVGSGLQWSTSRVMEEAGLHVVKAETLEHLLRMLELGRFMNLPRGMDEIFFEYEKWSEKIPDLAIEKNLTLFIPLPTYLFVSPERPDLAERFERGLRSMIADGSLDRLFWKYFQKDIERVGLDKRRTIRIPNPNLGPETPLDDPALWFTPGDIPPNLAKRQQNTPTEAGLSPQ
ncbi:ABC transporter substrate-binding protein [Labrenzia sp. OB1]|uniref:substrate-binding periplasmic protein n=1 Tax=Labrenzia sp. OB1 TaxID=1561204 RepID=UPI000A93C9C9|nr:ABC transporter substrate-binding protein [Labrenzia sp. OB1]